MREIKIICNPNGSYSKTDTALNFESELSATKVTLDFSTTQETLFNKWVELVMPDATEKIINLGTAALVEFELDQSITKTGTVYIHPYATDATSKVYWQQVEINVIAKPNVSNDTSGYVASALEQFQADLDFYTNLAKGDTGEISQAYFDTQIGNTTTLDTTSKEVVGAINELLARIEVLEGSGV